jgi:ribosomal protein S18 acetylase RimI-like enzyme
VIGLTQIGAPRRRDLLSRAIESDSTYFEMGAERQQLDGATMAWMPGLTRSPAAAVIHRVDPEAVASGGARWVAKAEAAMAEAGASLCRVYLETRHVRAEAALKSAGYAAREELVFLDSLPDPEIQLALRPVESSSDWAEKLRFHQEADETPDGHGNLAGDWVELERRKCLAGMETYLAELDGRVVATVGAIWCGDFVRAKNLVVASDRRRHGIGRAIVGSLAMLGRERGIADQCFVAVRGERGESLYRSVGMDMIGYQVEWSKPISAGAR